MVSCRYLRDVKQKIDMLISIRYLKDNLFYSARRYSVHKPPSLPTERATLIEQSKEAARAILNKKGLSIPPDLVDDLVEEIIEEELDDILQLVIEESQKA